MGKRMMEMNKNQTYFNLKVIIGAIMGLNFLIKIISVYMTYTIINNNRKIKLHLTCKFMKKNNKINFFKTIRKHLPYKLCNCFFNARSLQTY